MKHFIAIKADVDFVMCRECDSIKSREVKV